MVDTNGVGFGESSIRSAEKPLIFLELRTVLNGVYPTSSIPKTHISRRLVVSYKWNTEEETMWRSVEDAALHFGVSKTTMYNWIKKDKIRATVSWGSGRGYIVDINSISRRLQ